MPSYIFITPRLLMAALACAPLFSAQEPQGLLTATARPPITAAHLTFENRGDIFMARKMYREAIDMYRQAPETAATLNRIGIAYSEMSYLDLAKKNYEQAIKLDPRYAEVINNLGTIYYSERLYRRAIRYYKRSLRLEPSAASVYVNIGAAYFASRDYKKASAYYEQALALDPEVFETRSSFGTRMQESAVSDLASFHLYLAKAYAKRGLNERALLYLRKALEEGVHDRKKLPEAPEFSGLKKEAAFQQLLAENPRVL